MYLFLRERERDRERAWGAGRSTERLEDRRSEVGGALTAVSLMQGSNSQTVRSRPEPKLRGGHLID